MTFIKRTVSTIFLGVPKLTMSLKFKLGQSIRVYYDNKIDIFDMLLYDTYLT